MNNAFHLGVASGLVPRKLVNHCIQQLGDVRGKYQLGFIYATDVLSRDFEDILGRLKQETGVQQWVGSLGIGVCSNGVEMYDQAALVVMLADIDRQHFSILGGDDDDEDKLIEEISGHCKYDSPHVGVIHCDPSNPLIPNVVEKISETAPTAYLVGGLTSSNYENYQVANDIIEGNVSGIFFSPEVETVIAHTQGCTPFGRQHVVTRAQRNLLIELDGEPALDVLRADVGEMLAKDLHKIAGYIFAGLPIEFSDTGDYLVRNIIGIDEHEKSIAIGDYVYEGSQFMFCRRDGNSARDDMLRMLSTMRSRLHVAPKGGLYFSCLGRGRYQFGEHSEELKMIQSELGDFPLAGFFANGEIFNNRLYGYTGVLVLFI